ncbi:MAG: class I SAM-dependent methyltransferase [Nakamurella sp.]
MSTSTAAQLARWTAIWEAEPTGWSFGHLTCYNTDKPPWDFGELCQQHIETTGHTGSLLDLGTGGGERLLALAAAVPGGLPADTVATEGWPPNIEPATSALAAIGVRVLAYSDDTDGPMPFPANRFDLTMSCHESYRPDEVARTLRPGGVFLTQQVVGTEAGEFREWFGGRPQWPKVQREVFVAATADAGLRVTDSNDWTGGYHFADVDTMVGYLRIVPWDVPADFSPAAYADQLFALDDRLRQTGVPLRVT